jgi:hypothetical protein
MYQSALPTFLQNKCLNILFVFILEESKMAALSMFGVNVMWMTSFGKRDARTLDMLLDIMPEFTIPFLR